jgi:cytochrome c biogenesis protein CcdA/thiol-disulfide isomerase/thioredoxin
MIQILFALLAGILTIAAPCILPMLPILLGASVGQQSRQRPLYIVIGFILSFTLLSFVLSSLVDLFIRLNITIVGHQIGPRDIAIFFLAVFGFFMLFPSLFERLTLRLNGIINKANQAAGSETGNLGGFLLGFLLGIIWTPCAGPVLAAVLTLIATQGNTLRSTILLIAYAVGAGVPMLLIAYGSQYASAKIRSISKYSASIQKIFGVLIILLAFAMYMNYDVVVENQLAAILPSTSGLEAKISLTNDNPMNNVNQSASTTQGSSMETIQFQNYGKAPDFTGIDHWLNTPTPLTIQSLKGKVVLVDFWTYSCINCIRTLPFVTKWYNTYKNQGLVVVGVHTPEFAFEKVTANVQDAISRFNIQYPVAQDNEYGTWNAYLNEYWPAEYLIDQNGNIVYEHFGEGEYDHTENAIRELLGLSANVPTNNGQNLSQVNSPEMYFETSRLQYLTPQQQPSETAQAFALPQSLVLNTFALSGNWQFFNDHAQLMQPDGKIQLHFSSGKVYMVAASTGKPITIQITVDGQAQPDVTVSSSELYTLFNSNNYGDHTLEINIPDPGFEAFTFTFG